MKYEWDWASFFKQEIVAPFRVVGDDIEDLHRLIKLPFRQGLTIIVTCVPAFDHQQWTEFEAELKVIGHHHRYIDSWLLIGQLIRSYKVDVERLLAGHVEQAVYGLQRLLDQCDDIEQFALIACMHHFAQTNIKAQMLLQYFLQNATPHAQQLATIGAFYEGLTERQKDVATLVADGLTNQEIADALCIEPKVVAEHLTTIFAKFQQAIRYTPDRHGTRYRLIHGLTHLFLQHPELLLNRSR